MTDRSKRSGDLEDLLGSRGAVKAKKEVTLAHFASTLQKGSLNIQPKKDELVERVIDSLKLLGSNSQVAADTRQPKATAPPSKKAIEKKTESVKQEIAVAIEQFNLKYHQAADLAAPKKKAATNKVAEPTLL